ncbi:transcriptional regulator [Sulfolobales archaeon HS-7]|nr:transcriptional regulator [Sulfolobales archaeon HS-7]
MARDPVCGEEVFTNKYKLNYAGKEYVFCSPLCMAEFKKSPERYTKK